MTKSNKSNTNYGNSKKSSFISSSIANKITLSVAGIFIIILTVLSYINYKDSQIEAINLVGNERKRSVEGGKLILENKINGLISSIEHISNIIESNNQNYVNENIEFLLSTIAKTSNLKLIYMALDNNGMMYSTGDIKGLPTSNFDARDREWYKNAKNTNKLIITEPYISAANNLVSISAVKPIYINGKFVGGTWCGYGF
ncbi:cache domain-containing protein [Campylobacter fetus]|uniref:cache domain-containing protein n=1 Tax=Campylobacter fetus TaxID=196 RepID=UPI00041FC82E|nr:cache domain-containing protein [Campylobacter fetus]EAI4321183.1 hypothetical protein [Campylobacter fetus]EAI4390440.1 hypothetical protein [Campylobacter fetus]OCS07069.1 hypothetical protein CFTD6683_08390 [Campylobacter fetus subsp. testudinum]OCS07419.1 hypothetical protein CFTD6659_00010 [Campylobacter fetus subsp. testudinum]OCS09561.1 hypothetical protein CFTD6783_07600 [Campylobacter fetus subsp. testudinum]